MLLHLVVGDEIDQRSILRRLADLQYRRNDIDLKRGTYRVRGEVIDIHPADSEREAVRIELFDDKIDSLSILDPLLNKVIKKVPRITIFPKTHYVTPRAKILDTIEKVKVELEQRVQEFDEANKCIWDMQQWKAEHGSRS